MNTNVGDFDYCCFNTQTQLLGLNLQLAQAEEKPKRSGDFETIYKNESGKEIVVKRSPDGKFASKSGNANAAVAPKLGGGGVLDPQVARENGKAVREILTGKTGDDLKKDLAADFNHRPIVKEAIEKVDFAEVTKGDADALTNIHNFIQKKFAEAVNATSQLGREIAATAVFVATYVTKRLMSTVGSVGLLLVPATVALLNQKSIIELPDILKRTVSVTPDIIKYLLSSENLKYVVRRGLTLGAIYRAIDLAAHLLKKPTPPLVGPEADKALQQALVGIGNNTLQNSLIAGAAQSPGVAEGIKSTNIEDVIEGGQDAFSNAVAFMRDKVEEAATVVSENKKEIAIGAAVVALAVASAGATAILNTVAIRAGLTAVLGLLKGSSFSDALILGLKSAAPEKIKELASRKIYALAISLKLGITARQAIKEQVESVKLARSGGIGAKSFGQKEEAVKKLVAEEGLDYEKVLQAIARRKEEPLNPKRAAQIQQEILNLQQEIQKGTAAAQEILVNKSAINTVEMLKLTSVARKEMELRGKLIAKKGELEQAEGRGFSLVKRLNELVDIVGKEGKDNPSYKWRSNVIKAELKYGETLDNIENIGGYNKLLNTMKKDRPAPSKYARPSEADDRQFSSIFESFGSYSYTSASEKQNVLDKSIENGRELSDYLATPINVQVGLNGGLTCSLPGGTNRYSYIADDAALRDPIVKKITNTESYKNPAIDGYINIGDVALRNVGLRLQGYNTLASTDEHIKEMMWHESGHILEEKLGKVEESVAFREERAREIPADKKESPSLISDSASRDYALGNFYSPYIGLRIKGTGKYAQIDTATEVLSSGMELLSSPTLAKRGVKADRETILYALAAMNEKVKD